MAKSKLIRDNIYKIDKDKGINYDIHTANDIEFEKELLKKLREEVKEYCEDQNQEELADILEVFYAILDLKKFNFNEIEKIRLKKAKIKGTFKNRIIATKHS